MLTRRTIDEVAAKAALARHGIRIPRGVVLEPHGADADKLDLATLRPPMVAKLVSTDIVHKSDIGGVVLGLRDAAAVRLAVDDLVAAARDHRLTRHRLLVEEQAARGWELAVGGIVDPQFGPMVMLGLGGVHVELLDAVAFRLAPIDEADARSMIAETPVARLADGFRGQPPIDVDALLDTLLRVGGTDGLLMTADPELDGSIVELDINPLIAGPDGAIAADASITVADPAPTRGHHVADDAAPTDFSFLLEPRSIAVVGASSTGQGHGANFLRLLRAYGYPGRVHPIHPQAGEVDGLRAYRSLADLPEPVDYAYVAVAAPLVPYVLEQAAGKVRVAQVVSSGFGEIGDTDTEGALVRIARRGGVRLIGPNCLGTHSPAGRVTFVTGAGTETGGVAVVSQSGGLTVDVIRCGETRGLRLRAAVSVGNAADVTPTELLDYFLDDPATDVIGLYLEDAGEGRRVFDRLRREHRPVPVVVLAGGATSVGRAAAASHTGALAGDQRAWQAFAAQTGAAVVGDLERFIDALVAFQHLRPRPSRPTADVVLLGNGGGASVLSADSLARVGLSLTEFGERTAAALRALDLPPGTSLTNPIDTPIGALAARDGLVAGQILDVVLSGDDHPDAIVVHLNLPVLETMIHSGDAVMDRALDAVVGAATRHGANTHVMLVLRSDGTPDIDAHGRRLRARANAGGVPVYPTVADAAAALAAVAGHERKAKVTCRSR